MSQTPKPLATLLLALLCLGPGPALATAEVTAIAREAFLYGYPMVDGYSILLQQALDPKSPGHQAPMNTISHRRRLAAPQDRTIVSPNTDTLMSYAWLDLRAEPVVLSLPAVPEGRYVSVQLIDTYTYILGYVSRRTGGSDGGNFLIAGPDWQGEVPAGVREVFRSPTQFVLALIRTQIHGPDDLPNAFALQDRMGLQTLSSRNRQAAPASPPPLRPVAPIEVRRQPTSMAFFTVLNWMLQFMPTLPEEQVLRQRLARIGVVPGRPFEEPDETQRAALVAGMRQGQADMMARLAQFTTTSRGLFGSRERLKDDYLTRAVASMVGMYGNAEEEFLGVGYPYDAQRQPFDGRHRYRIRFAADGLPPVGAFWSITAYTADRFLHDNEIGRYKISSSMGPNLRRDADGGVTLYVQHDNPGPPWQSNWLPVPSGPFHLTFRTYLPGDAIRNGTWTAPPVQRAEP